MRSRSDWAARKFGSDVEGSGDFRERPLAVSRVDGSARRAQPRLKSLPGVSVCPRAVEVQDEFRVGARTVDLLDSGRFASWSSNDATTFTRSRVGRARKTSDRRAAPLASLTRISGGIIITSPLMPSGPTPPPKPPCPECGQLNIKMAGVHEHLQPSSTPFPSLACGRMWISRGTPAAITQS